MANAAVNFATGRAVVTFDPAAVGLDDLVHAVRDVGYDVIEVPKAPAAHGGRRRRPSRTLEDLEQKAHEAEYRDAPRQVRRRGRVDACRSWSSAWRTSTSRG